MKPIYGMILAAGLAFGQASVADAQVSVSIGNPYTGSGIQIGPGYGPGYGLGGVGTSYYNSGYSGYAAPGTSSFVTGSFAPAYGVYGAPTYGVYGAPAYGILPPVAVPYSTYGYSSYGYSSYRRGFGIPFLGRRRW